MKRSLFLFVASLFIGQALYAQQELIAYHPGNKPLTGQESNISNSENRELFVFKVYATDAQPKGEIESHYLGDEIAGKWTLVNELYLKKSEVSVGFGNSYTEIIKPSVFNAVNRMNNYYRKAVNKGEVKIEEAQQQFSWILECAIAIYQNDNTEMFEKTLVKLKDPSQILQLFNSVRIDRI